MFHLLRFLGVEHFSIIAFEKKCTFKGYWTVTSIENVGNEEDQEGRKSGIIGPWYNDKWPDLISGVWSFHDGQKFKEDTGSISFEDYSTKEGNSY